MRNPSALDSKKKEKGTLSYRDFSNRMKDMVKHFLLMGQKTTPAGTVRSRKRKVVLAQTSSGSDSEPGLSVWFTV